jgi:UTP--glucose-1-phosphate uridylyltransferase
MLPVFVKNRNGQILLKPVIQLAFERLYDAGVREFLFVVGRGKRSIEDHFTIDNGFVDQLKRAAKPHLVEEMKWFYRRVRNSNIAFINQPEPLGFGEAVLRARAFTGEQPFIVHAGDDLILSTTPSVVFRRLMKTFHLYGADAVFFVQKVKDPTKYGVVEGKEVESGTYYVEHVEEKPKRPRSKNAIVALYVFNGKIYGHIKKTPNLQTRELELTSAIQHLIENGGHVYALKLKSNETRLDVGTPESYWNALRTTMIQWNR